MASPRPCSWDCWPWLPCCSPTACARPQATVVGVVIFARVAGPLFTTDTNVRFFAVQTAKAADQQGAARNRR